MVARGPEPGSQALGQGVGAQGLLPPPDPGSYFRFRYRDHQSWQASLCAVVAGPPRSGFGLPSGVCQRGAGARSFHNPGFDAAVWPGMVLSLVGRDAAAARAQVDALRGLSEAGLFLEPWADSLTSRSSAREGQEDLHQMRQGLATFEMVGTPLGRAAQLLLLAQGYTRAGKVEAAMAALDEALAWMDRSGVCMLEAEAHRLRGELLLAGRFPGAETSDSAVGATAEECFRRAIAVARRQEARWWELRATVSLCRLLKERNAPQDARPSRSSPDAGGGLRPVQRGVRNAGFARGEALC